MTTNVPGGGTTPRISMAARLLRRGGLLSACIGLLWGCVAAVTVAVVMAFATGGAFAPALAPAALFGAIFGLALTGGRPPEAVALFVRGAVSHLPVMAIWRRWTRCVPWQKTALRWLFLVLALALMGIVAPLLLPVSAGTDMAVRHLLFTHALFAGALLPLQGILQGAELGRLTRHEAEQMIIRFLAGFGYLFFAAIVLIPFYVMVMTSLKSQQALLQNPLDFRLEPGRGWEIFSSYIDLFKQFNFGSYMWTSFLVSVLTVVLTLLFSIPGAYAVARLRFRGQAALSRGILLIYMVPMIVLALPIYIGYSMIGLRNSLIGIVLIYPVTTIPVALYMLQGYFRGLPYEVEEAGLMDGLGRLAVIWRITLPLSLPALAAVSLYVFMIAWNEFLLAFMLLDDPSKFTLTRGVAMLNSSEIPRQHLMAGAVVATVPVMALFLGLERFMTRGLAQGAVKG